MPANGFGAGALPAAGMLPSASVSAIWEDEESDSTIHNECLLRTMTTQGIVILTYTPLHGLTPLTLEFKETATLLTEGMD